MQAKVLEIRDEGTFIPMLCVNIHPSNAEQRYLMRRCGYACDGQPNVVMTSLHANGDKSSNDPYFWGGRTRPVAHQYIIDNWHTLNDGDVIDVSFILGETKTKKISERISS